MLIYEKDNKLNINFENSVDGEPDLQIGKDGDKTKILVDGQLDGGSSGGGNFIIGFNEETRTFDKTWQEIHDAMSSGKLCISAMQDQEMVNEAIAMSTGMSYENEDSSDETSATIPVYTVNFISLGNEVEIATAKAKRTPSAYPAFKVIADGPVPGPGILEPTPAF